MPTNPKCYRVILKPLHVWITIKRSCQEWKGYKSENCNIKRYLLGLGLCQACPISVRRLSINKELPISLETQLWNSDFWQKSSIWGLSHLFLFDSVTTSHRSVFITVSFIEAATSLLSRSNCPSSVWLSWVASEWLISLPNVS